MKTEDKFSRFIVTSAVLHAGLAGFVLIAPALFAPDLSETWGSTTGSTRVGVVGSLPGIELPSPPVVHEKVPASDSASLHPPEPAPKPQPKVEPKPDVLIPSKTAATRPDKPSPASSPTSGATKTEVPAVSNAVPTVGGGQAAIPYGQAGTGTGPASIGDEAFGMRYGWYVTAMTRAIREKWQPAGSGPKSAPRVYVTFTIAKDGTVSNLAVEQSSGSTLEDNAARRAVLTASLQALPKDYLKGSIDVRFYFEYVR